MKKLMLTTAVIAAMLVVPLAASAKDKYPHVDKHVVTYKTDDTFHFSFDGDIILNGSKKEANAKVEELAQHLKEHPSCLIRIEGFTDEVGTKFYNLDLSHRRILGVKAMLLQKGVKSTQIIAVPYGELNELRDGHSDEAWAANRRVRIHLIAQ